MPHPNHGCVVTDVDGNVVAEAFLYAQVSCAQPCEDFCPREEVAESAEGEGMLR